MPPITRQFAFDYVTQSSLEPPCLTGARLLRIDFTQKRFEGKKEVSVRFVEAIGRLSSARVSM